LACSCGQLRLAHQNDVRDIAKFPDELVLEASDSAVQIHEQEFAKYLALDIENTGVCLLYEECLADVPFDRDPRAAAPAAR
jgi:hypothetical protein